MLRLLLLLSTLCSALLAAGHSSPRPAVVGTYSIVAFDPDTGELGVGVQSKFFGVGSVVPFARAGVGALATQAQANVEYGPEGLRLLGEGKSAEEVVRALTESDTQREVRQLAVVDAEGRPAAFTGSRCHRWAGHQTGRHYTVQGNILASEKVVAEMAAAFESARSKEGTSLADWMMAALHAAEAAGGDTRGRQSAALLVVRERGGFGGKNDRFIDLRVEDHPEPLQELSRLLQLHKEFYAHAHRRTRVR